MGVTIIRKYYYHAICHWNITLSHKIGLQNRFTIFLCNKQGEEQTKQWWKIGLTRNAKMLQWLFLDPLLMSTTADSWLCLEDSSFLLGTVSSLCRNGHIFGSWSGWKQKHGMVLRKRQNHKRLSKIQCHSEPHGQYASLRCVKTVNDQHCGPGTHEQNTKEAKSMYHYNHADQICWHMYQAYAIAGI